MSSHKFRLVHSASSPEVPVASQFGAASLYRSLEPPSIRAYSSKNTLRWFEATYAQTYVTDSEKRSLGIY